jgi:hypothetical protein
MLLLWPYLFTLDCRCSSRWIPSLPCCHSPGLTSGCSGPCGGHGTCTYDTTMKDLTCTCLDDGGHYNVSTDCVLCDNGWSETAGCKDCTVNHFGSNCQPCATTNGLVCNGHGECDSGIHGDGGCTCSSNFTGPSCTECVPNHYGANCSLLCPPCSLDRGVCSQVCMPPFLKSSATIAALTTAVVVNELHESEASWFADHSL